MFDFFERTYLHKIKLNNTINLGNKYLYTGKFFTAQKRYKELFKHMNIAIQVTDIDLG